MKVYCVFQRYYIEDFYTANKLVKIFSSSFEKAEKFIDELITKSAISKALSEFENKWEEENKGSHLYRTLPRPKFHMKECCKKNAEHRFCSECGADTTKGQYGSQKAYEVALSVWGVQHNASAAKKNEDLNGAVVKFFNESFKKEIDKFSLKLEDVRCYVAGTNDEFFVEEREVEE